MYPIIYSEILEKSKGKNLREEDKKFITDFYKYSLQALELIVNEIKKDPDNILDNIKNKLTPGAKDF